MLGRLPQRNVVGWRFGLKRMDRDSQLVRRAHVVGRINQCPFALVRHRCMGQTPPKANPQDMPAKVCWGPLGFRARQTRKQQYSVFEEQLAGRPSQVRHKSKRKIKPTTDTRKTE
jgi:hypothetical protein